jgi:simple sugar transport system permease protein
MSFLFVSRVLAIPEEQSGMAVIIVILLALTIGALSGLLNGNLISRLGIPPIIATLSTQMVFRGITIGFTRGDAITGIPPIFSEIGRRTLYGLLSVPLLVFIIVFLFCAFLLKYTVFGKKLYMIGSNHKAARFSAIDTTRMINLTFMLNGIIATIGTLLMVANMNSARANFGATYLMRCILILVLAGVLPSGGMGKIVNVLISIITIQIIASGVNMFPDLNAFYGSLVSAVLLLIVLVATSYMVSERKSRKVDDIENKAPSSA